MRGYRKKKVSAAEFAAIYARERARGFTHSELMRGPLLIPVSFTGRVAYKLKG